MVSSQLDGLEHQNVTFIGLYVSYFQHVCYTSNAYPVDGDVSGELDGRWSFVDGRGGIYTSFNTSICHSILPPMTDLIAKPTPHTLN